jgi:hypothetical protein
MDGIYFQKKIEKMYTKFLCKIKGKFLVMSNKNKSYRWTGYRKMFNSCRAQKALGLHNTITKIFPLALEMVTAEVAPKNTPKNLGKI